MREFKLNGGLKDDLLKVVVNGDGDAIYLNPNDGTFMDKVARFMSWFLNKADEMQKMGEEISKEYEGKEFVSEDGNVDAESLLKLTNIQLEVLKEISEEIDKVFGQDTLRKYFKPYYEINPDFVPDLECVNDFLDQIGPAISEAFNTRNQSINSQYSKNRRKAPQDHKKKS